MLKRSANSSSPSTTPSKASLTLNNTVDARREGVAIHIAQRVQRWPQRSVHNFQTGQAVTRSPTAYDH